MNARRMLRSSSNCWVVAYLGEAIEFLKRIESIEEHVRTLLQGEIEGHLEVGESVGDDW